MILTLYQDMNLSYFDTENWGFFILFRLNTCIFSYLHARIKQSKNMEKTESKQQQQHPNTISILDSFNVFFDI